MNDGNSELELLRGIRQLQERDNALLAELLAALKHQTQAIEKQTKAMERQSAQTVKLLVEQTQSIRETSGQQKQALEQQSRTFERHLQALELRLARQSGIETWCLFGVFAVVAGIFIARELRR
eukprot:TRINITY_DN23512_c0_g1_i1.p1 TRINITY_DN23512_c0_g1~~TRINITY_DN23512_c0_g1_i1.p1  ORF type:complete len:123 (+),score=22.07 TRINITY_DN23512_c0_g1_i1:152-520(+)